MRRLLSNRIKKDMIEIKKSLPVIPSVTLCSPVKRLIRLSNYLVSTVAVDSHVI